jgi:hypothetical protein
VLVLPPPHSAFFRKLLFEILVTCAEVRKEGKALVELVLEELEDRDYMLYFNGVRQISLNKLTEKLKEDSDARVCCKYLK